jgi:two-component sensor histidine kinase
MKWLGLSTETPRRIRDPRLTAINFLTDAVNRTLDLREVIDNAVHAILAVTRVEAGAVYRWHEAEGMLRLLTSRGLAEAFTRQVAAIRRGQDGTLDAVLEGGTCVTDDFVVAVDDRRREPVTAGFRTTLLAPIRARGKTLGLLVLGSYRGRPFEQDNVDLIEVIANQVGIAITKAELLEDLGRKNRLLELLMDEAHHRIKNNLQMISGLLQLDLAGSDPGPGAERLQHAIQQIQAIAHVHNLLSKEVAEKVDAKALITALTRTLLGPVRPGQSDAEIELDLEQLWLGADQAVALALIVNELTSNALLHGRPPAGDSLEVFVACHTADGKVVLTVVDNGGGIPEKRPKRPGGGQGMEIVTQLAQVNLRGALWIRNEGNGTRAELQFKLAENVGPHQTAKPVGGA